MKKQTINWQKIFANHISDTALIPRMYKELSNSTIKKQTVQLENRLNT